MLCESVWKVGWLQPDILEWPLYIYIYDIGFRTFTWWANMGILECPRMQSWHLDFSKGTWITRFQSCVISQCWFYSRDQSGRGIGGPCTSWRQTLIHLNIWFGCSSKLPPKLKIPILFVLSSNHRPPWRFHGFFLVEWTATGPLCLGRKKPIH